MFRRLYCTLTLCYLLDYVGGQYSPKMAQPWRGITRGAQRTWDKSHDTRVFHRLEGH